MGTAFALPMLQLLAGGRPRARQTCGLVLVPTRELAMQVAEAIHRYGAPAPRSQESAPMKLETQLSRR